MAKDLKLEDSISSLDKRLKELEQKVNGNGSSKPPKAPRASSKYNDFMKDYITKEKNKGTTKSHKDLFSEGAKAWSEQKDKK